MRFLRLIPLLLAAWLYMPALRLPFFWDDVIHFRYVSGVSSEHLLTRAELVAYYRPLVNLILQIPFLLNQTPSAPLWHLILVLNHVLNVALVGALANHLRLNRVAQFWAMTVFAVYPFSFQAVVWVLAWFHPLVVTLILLACVTGLRAMRHPGEKLPHRAAWTAGALAPFIHENGVLTAPLLALLIAFTVPRKDWRRAVPILIPIGLGAAAYGLIALRLGVGAGDGVNFADSRFNAAYLMQGLSFPVQWLMGNVWLGGAIFLAIMALVLRRDALRWRVTALGIAWFLLAGLPVLLLLEESYVTSAPRLLYLGSVGLALMFGVEGEGLFFTPLLFSPRKQGEIPNLAGMKPLPASGEGLGRGQFTASYLMRAGTVILMLTLVILSANYVRGRLALHNDLGAGYHQLDDLLSAQDESASMLVINAPMWLDTETSDFPLGKYGAIFVPEYYGLNDFVWANTGMNFAALDTIFYYPALDGWPGHVSGLKGVQAVDAGTTHGYISGHDVIYAFYVRDADHFTARIIGQRAEVTENYRAEFSPGMRLIDLTSQHQEDGLIAVAITWQRSSESAVLERPFLHLICDDAIIDQVDSHPIGNLYHFNVWPLGEAWTEYRYLDANDAPQDCLRLRLGLYNEESGARAAIFDADGQPIPQDFLILPLG